MAIQVPTELLDGSVLGLLTQQDHYGYTLTQEVRQLLPISESTLYPVLRRLKKNGWLDTYDEPFQGRNRRYYRLTDSGRERLAEIQGDWQDFNQAISQLLEGNTHE
ncbi:PadR family transcriptional regulator [Levilactobacillus parabrevis]|uniref:Transcriptional regulator n=1 Tax=Levilactobacillus parabrevis ATCC 53295 TaxID=1267003 RepID=A0A0R1GYQ0_9LACO|nr:PadR family transcriptional regulator [Levilactobacillus parabrevis]KRK39333.1 transcriptional regulator [Levilactobacillus parabrevis ATCC 53295]KRO07234.1 transcriptional regulator [Levilactobacillus parabrevis]MCT4487477.1 PadR family transcriptional regulator [Levilactobacillus parabrevis]MCT4490565.1 PadR family transcriptional regulator [Levilactobacillus parabrevis]